MKKINNIKMISGIEAVGISVSSFCFPINFHQLDSAIDIRVAFALFNWSITAI